MLWALAITVCVAHDADVTCQKWRSGPVTTKYLCQRERSLHLAYLEETNYLYLHLECERGHYL